MIVRILGERQYDVPPDAMPRLDQLDADLQRAIDSADEPAADRALAALIAEIRSLGTALDPSTLTPSDLTVPHEGSSMKEIVELLASETEPDPAGSVTEGA